MLVAIISALVVGALAAWLGWLAGSSNTARFRALAHSKQYENDRLREEMAGLKEASAARAPRKRRG